MQLHSYFLNYLLKTTQQTFDRCCSDARRFLCSPTNTLLRRLSAQGAKTVICYVSEKEKVDAEETVKLVEKARIIHSPPPNHDP